jgi:hypothetical protein
MSVKVYYEILNQKGTPAFYSDTYANRPAFGFAGRVFISTDTGQIFEDTGSAWTLIADAGVGGGTLASVTANGNTTATGIVITAGGLSTDSLTDTALTSGSVLFSGTGGLVSQKNANLFWDNTNNRLGIGINSPGAPLDIHATGTNAQFNGTGTNNAYLQFQNAGTSKWRIGNTYNAGANSFDIYNNGLATNALSINSTTNALTGVSFEGTATDGNYFLRNEDVEFVNNAIANSIRLVGRGAASQSYLYFGSTGTNYFGYNGTNFILNGGNLGIGTTTPTSRLVVNGSGDQNILLNSTTSNNCYAIYTNLNKTYLTGLSIDVGTNSYVIYDLTVGTPRMAITSGGNMLIGSSTDGGDKLQITGSVRSNGSGAGFFFENRTGSSLFGGLYMTGATFYFYNGSSNIASINYSTGVYTPLSDINKKKDFELSNIGLNAILGLKPTLYRMKNEVNTDKHLGFIAQEVKEFIPQAYVESEDFIGLNFNPIIATLVKAIQELNEKLERNNIN